MSRRGAGLARWGVGRAAEPSEAETVSLEFVETPALGRVVITAARQLMAGGMAPAEASSLFAHAAATLAQQGESRLSRAEWLALCAVLWDGPSGHEAVTAPGGRA